MCHLLLNLIGKFLLAIHDRMLSVDIRYFLYFSFYFQETQPNKAMIDVQFENSKVLVGFRSNTNAQNRRPGQASSIGEVTTTKTNLTPIVLHHVYVSMKLKMQSREQLKIRLYKLSEAQRYLSFIAL